MTQISRRYREVLDAMGVAYIPELFGWVESRALRKCINRNHHWPFKWGTNKFCRTMAEMADAGLVAEQVEIHVVHGQRIYKTFYRPTVRYLAEEFCNAAELEGRVGQGVPPGISAGTPRADAGGPQA